MGRVADAVGVLWSIVHRVPLDFLGEMPDMGRVAEFVGHTSRCELTADHRAVLLSACVDGDTPLMEQLSRTARRAKLAFVSAGIPETEARRAINLAEVTWVLVDPTDAERRTLLERRASV